MYFLSNAVRVGKLIVSGIGLLVGGGALAYGIVTSAPLAAVGGGLYFATSLLLAFDGTKVLQDIKREVERLKTNIFEFKAENKLLEASRKAFQENNRELSDNNKELKQRIHSLRDAEAQLHAENERLAQSIEAAEAQLAKLTKAGNATQHENERLAALVGAAQQQLMAMEQAKLAYEQENERYRAMLAESDGQLASLRQQVDKLRELHENSKQLIRNLVDAGDMFDRFSSTLGQDLDKLDGVADDITTAAGSLSSTIARLNGEIAASKFAEIDADGDGVITQDEFARFATI